MFIKLTENDTALELYFNEDHIVKIVPNSGGEGSFIFLSPLTSPSPEPHYVLVHEHADEIFRMMGRMHR
jgi:hypothetical protein